MKNNPTKTILITGGNGGLGKSIANKLVQLNHRVIVTSRAFEPKYEDIVSDNRLIKQYLDVTDECSVKQLFTWLTTSNIKLDILINNAGIGVFKPLVEITLDEWNSVIATNLTGAFLCAKEACKNMQVNGGGRIINIGSVAEKIPLPDNAVYGASKGALKIFSAILNEEAGHEKIRATHITLGATYTDIWKTRLEFNKEDMLDPSLVADYISYIALLPLSIRIDHVEILPEKGIL